jgi:hypothetical protein
MKYLIICTLIISILGTLKWIHSWYINSLEKDIAETISQCNEVTKHYAFYIAPPFKGQKAKIVVYFDGIIQISPKTNNMYMSLKEASIYSQISTGKIKELIGAKQDYSNFKFKQLKY